ncbi:hypothetical protein, partial [Microcystis aeruginosa]|uniref:hypothetical protein n=1 Tax=Microcystis aeruginosa TaxID=1126 RepID=UPI001C404C08
NASSGNISKRSAIPWVDISFRPQAPFKRKAAGVIFVDYSLKEKHLELRPASCEVSLRAGVEISTSLLLAIYLQDAKICSMRLPLSAVERVQL